MKITQDANQTSPFGFVAVPSAGGDADSIDPDKVNLAVSCLHVRSGNLRLGILELDAPE